MVPRTLPSKTCGWPRFTECREFAVQAGEPIRSPQKSLGLWRGEWLDEGVSLRGGSIFEVVRTPACFEVFCVRFGVLACLDVVLIGIFHFNALNALCELVSAFC
jgi:hypothetical protein